MKIYREDEKFIIHGLPYHINRLNENSYFATCENAYNGAIFSLLKIEDKYKFCSDVVGYKIQEHGIFPYFKTLEDINKVIHALINYNNNPDIIEMETMEGYNF